MLPPGKRWQIWRGLLKVGKREAAIEGDASKTDFDSQRCAIIEKQFGAITGKYVIYRGDTYVPSCSNNIKYINIEEYLRSLSVDK